MIKPEQDCEQNSERERHEHLAGIEVPEVDEPVSAAGGHEGATCREHLKVDFLHPSNVNKTREKDDCKWSAVVLQEYAYPVLKEATRSKNTTQIGTHENEESGDNGKVERSTISQPLQDLNALLKINESDIESKDVARKPGDPSKPIARVSDGKQDVEDQRPSTDVS